MCFAENSRGELRLEGGDGSRTGAISTGGGKPGQGQPVVAVSIRGREGGGTAELGGEQSTALRASQGGGDKQHILTNRSVRRLTPVECERLQGFPDNWTLVPYGTNRAKDFREWLAYLRLCISRLTEDEARRLAADGPRYKAIGNSMAVPCMHWIGERIQAVEALVIQEAAE